MGEGINQANTGDFLTSNNSLSESETFINHQEPHFYPSNFFFFSSNIFSSEKASPVCHLEQVRAEGETVSMARKTVGQNQRCDQQDNKQITWF